MPITPPPLPRYYIVSLALGVNEQPLYLTQSGDQVVVHYQPSPSAIWHLVAELGGQMIVNAQSGQALYGPFMSGQAVFMGQASPNPNSVWMYAHHTPFQTALAPQDNFNVNLNVKGNSYPDGSQVVVFHWDGGYNSRWTIAPVTA